MNLAEPKGSTWFSEIIQVTNGEGNLTFEGEFIYGLKLNEKVRFNSIIKGHLLTYSYFSLLLLVSLITEAPLFVVLCVVDH